MNQVATTPATPVDKLRHQLSVRANEFKMALPSHISPERFQRTLLTAVHNNPDLLSCDRSSLILAAMKLAHAGLLPDGREAVIVPFKESKKVDGKWEQKLIATAIEMVLGIRKKIYQAKDTHGNAVVTVLEADVVYRAEVDAGYFIWQKDIVPPIRHKPMFELTAEQTRDSEIVAAYSIATMATGEKSYEVMRRFQIDAIRERSKTGATKDRDGKPRNAGGPWVTDFAEMAKKTVTRRHSKTLPMSSDVIIDVGGDDDEMIAIESTTTLLGSSEGGQARLMSDDEVHDLETGEIIEQGRGSTENTPDSSQSDQKPAEIVEKQPKSTPKQAKKAPEKAEKQVEKGEKTADLPSDSAEPIPHGDDEWALWKKEVLQSIANGTDMKAMTALRARIDPALTALAEINMDLWDEMSDAYGDRVVELTKAGA